MHTNVLKYSQRVHLDISMDEAQALVTVLSGVSDNSLLNQADRIYNSLRDAGVDEGIFTAYIEPVEDANVEYGDKPYIYVLEEA